MIATTMMSKMSNESWAPVPTSADRSTKLLGTLNTSNIPLLQTSHGHQ